MPRGECWDSRSKSFTAQEEQFLEEGKMLGVGSRWVFGGNSIGNTGNTILMGIWVLGNPIVGRLRHSIAVSWEAAPGSQEASQWDRGTYPGLPLGSQNWENPPGCTVPLGMPSRSRNDLRKQRKVAGGRQG